MTKFRITKMLEERQYNFEYQTQNFAYSGRFVWNVRVWDFGFISDFDIRISSLRHEKPPSNLLNEFWSGSLDAIAISYQVEMC